MPETEPINDSYPIKPQAACLIRCWCEGDRWHFSIEDVASRRRRRYDSLEALLEEIETRWLDMIEGGL